MKVIILALGTRGDCELFLSLAAQLSGRGHSVLFCTSPFYQERAKELKVEVVTVGSGTLAEQDAILSSLSSITNLTARTYQFYKDWLLPQLSAAKSKVAELAVNADYFINNLKMVLQRDGSIIPGAFVTYDIPANLRQLDAYGSAKYNGQILELVAMPKDLVDPQREWEEKYHFTGFWQAAPFSNWETDDNLLGFLEKKPPPVVLTLGSMTMDNFPDLLPIFANALKLTGQRAVVIGSKAAQDHDISLSSNIIAVEKAAYSWLFPQVSCVIHHGGTGTTREVLLAGKPSIILPQILCQQNLADVLLREKLAAAVYTSTAAIRSEELAKAISRAICLNDNPESALPKWQRVILAEKGVAEAIDLIESHWKNLGAH